MQEAKQELLELGYRIVALSPDSPENLGQTAGKLELDYRLLSDSEAEAAKAFRLAYRVPEPTVEALKGYGIDLARASGEDHQILPVPAVYLIGSDGLVHFQYVNPIYQVRLHPAVLLAAARAGLGK